MSKDGGPAFPALHSIDGNWVKDPRPEYAGMSLLDYFAGQALPAAASESYGLDWGKENVDDWPNRVAKRAYRIADAMLAEREKSR